MSVCFIFNYIVQNIFTEWSLSWYCLSVFCQNLFSKLLLFYSEYSLKGWCRLHSKKHLTNKFHCNFIMDWTSILVYLITNILSLSTYTTNKKNSEEYYAHHFFNQPFYFKFDCNSKPIRNLEQSFFNCHILNFRL